MVRQKVTARAAESDEEPQEKPGRVVFGKEEDLPTTKRWRVTWSLSAVVDEDWAVTAVQRVARQGSRERDSLAEAEEFATEKLEELVGPDSQLREGDVEDMDDGDLGTSLEGTIRLKIFPKRKRQCRGVGRGAKRCAAANVAAEEKFAVATVSVKVTVEPLEVAAFEVRWEVEGKMQKFDDATFSDCNGDECEDAEEQLLQAVRDLGSLNGSITVKENRGFARNQLLALLNGLKGRCNFEYADDKPINVTHSLIMSSSSEEEDEEEDPPAPSPVGETLTATVKLHVDCFGADLKNVALVTLKVHVTSIRVPQ